MLIRGQPFAQLRTGLQILLVRRTAGGRFFQSAISTSLDSMRSSLGPVALREMQHGFTTCFSTVLCPIPYRAAMSFCFIFSSRNKIKILTSELPSSSRERRTSASESSLSKTRSGRLPPPADFPGGRRGPLQSAQRWQVPSAGPRR